VLFAWQPPRRSNIVAGGVSILTGFSDGRVCILVAESLLPVIVE
jgi:hypothetical protein